MAGADAGAALDESELENAQAWTLNLAGRFRSSLVEARFREHGARPRLSRAFAATVYFSSVTVLNVAGPYAISGSLPPAHPSVFWTSAYSSFIVNGVILAFYAGLLLHPPSLRRLLRSGSSGFTFQLWLGQLGA